LSNVLYSQKNKASIEDVLITKDKYLSTDDKTKKLLIEKKFKENNIPEILIRTRKTVNPEEKINFYLNIKKDLESRSRLEEIMKKKNFNYTLEDYHYLNEIIVNSINSNNSSKIFFRKYNNESIFFAIDHQLINYVNNGFQGLLSYELNKEKNIDNSIRKISNLVYRVFRYGLVKYLDLIDLIYKDFKGIDQDENTSLSNLIINLEYGAFSERGIIASDYGASPNIIKVIDRDEKITLDSYEEKLYKEIKSIIE